MPIPHEFERDLRNGAGRLLCAVALAWSSLAMAEPVVRTLEIRLEIDAAQDWKNDHQWGKSTSKQRYVLSSQLRSDGRLYADNLLDPDPGSRMKIKSDWYLYQGLSELKRENGGTLPEPGEGRTEISAGTLGMSGGMVSPQMASLSPQRLTALQALKDTPRAELEAFMSRYEQPGGRWMVFEGFPGCANQLQLQYHSRFEGDVAKKRGNQAPFSMQWDAETRGSPEQQALLCGRFVATYEPATDTLILENLYLPAPQGISIRHHFGRTERVERELPPPYQVMRWADDQLKQARSSGSRSATLPLTAALDGNDAALGSFTGTAKVSMEWSFR
jgi:hypothetical protein